MGDGSTHADPLPTTATTEERRIDGTGTAPGIAIGTVYRHDAAVPDVRREAIPEGEIEAELDLLSNAVQRAEQELETVRILAHESLEADSEAIIEAQAMMLQDEQLLQTIRDRIREQQESAGAAVKAVLSEHRERLEDSDDAYLRDRVEDIVDLERRLLRSLQRGRVAAHVGPHSIVVGRSLTATDLLRFSRHGVIGCVTAEGGPTSHVSIIAKALDLPTLVGVGGDLEAVSSGNPVILDGEQGCLILHPDPSTVEHYEERRAEEGRDSGTEGKTPTPPPAMTTDGHVVPLRANVELEAELDLLGPYGADGVGLFRTEMLFLAEGGGMLSEDRQVQVYRDAAEAAGDHGATIRLLDLGGDKRPPFGPRERNPSLGWRGIRVLLDRPDELLRPQLRALLRANVYGNLRMLLPMVGHLGEVRRLRSILEEEIDRLSTAGVSHDPSLPVGMMVEVPAAALMAKAFAERVDFFSVGTNDLTQYVLAVDRDNDWVADRYDVLHPAVLGLIRRAAKAGHSEGCAVEVCGESAGDERAVPVLLGLGVDTLSVSPPSLPAVRRLIRQIALEDARALADDVRSASDVETVHRRVEAWVDAHVSSESVSAEDDSFGE